MSTIRPTCRDTGFAVPPLRLAAGLAICVQAATLAGPPAAADAAARPAGLVSPGRQPLAAEPPTHAARPCVPAGTLLLGGGGDLDDAMWRRFIELAGGPDAPLAVFTAATAPTAGRPPRGIAELRRLGARDVTVLDARTPQEVEARGVPAALERARGVWLVGGRQWRYLDAFDGTRVPELLRGVLARGGVIGGTSAGAAVQADFMVRGSPAGNAAIEAEGYDRGLRLLPGTAIDTHVASRHRLADIVDLVTRRPQFLGIAIDEGTVAEVRGVQLTVLGRGAIRLVDARCGSVTITELRAASATDLAAACPPCRQPGFPAERDAAREETPERRGEPGRRETE